MTSPWKCRVKRKKRAGNQEIDFSDWTESPDGSGRKDGKMNKEIIGTDIMTNIDDETATIYEWDDGVHTVKFSDDSITYDFKTWDRAVRFCEKYGYRF